MKLNRQTLIPILAVLVAALLAAGCGSLTPPEVTTAPEAATVPAITTATPVPTLGEPTIAAPIATLKPLILEGATTTASGLQFLEQSAGSGAAPQEGDLLSLNFSGSLPDGTEFANTKQRGQPVYIVYGQGQLLPGFEEGLGLMKAGSKARLVLPPELAYGEQGYGVIPPNSQVVLDVELLTVEKPPQPAAFTEESLTTTASGLKYTDLTSGSGTEAQAGDTVTNRFTIWVKGEGENQYVTSSLGGEPLQFVQGAGDTVFPGWEEGVLGMKVGGKRLLVVPPELALGASGGSGIPANATLIMEVELTDVAKPPEMTKVDPADYTTTASGLQYYDIATGDGASPTAGQTVSVHYSGWLEDGTLFDSSVVGGDPFTFTLGTGSVIPGWDEGLLGMKVGGKRQLRIPADLAYGEAGAGGVIPPGATLIFDIELLDVQP